ncbi:MULTISPECIES: nuclear transport factor 2 family protein [unclassified Mycobacterium]|uniref:nuclear transport factor 2 family protein n=1 Tax=unclassified Mycobacterium TaxID=2642494 RepID=UPI0029C84743|nr:MULTISPECIES: nuclear transport factor 2 family protein [unclassified Mycobacterium]
MTVNETTERLMHANLLEVFNERDSQTRGAAIDRTYAEDVLWTDDEGVTVGRAALATKAGLLQQHLGDLQFRAAGPVQQTLGFGYLAWNLVNPADETVVSRGFDVALIAEDRVTHLYTVLVES